MTAIIQNRCSFRTELAECGNRHKKIGYLCFIIITLLTTLPMKRHHLLFLFAAFIAITSSAQKLDNLVELKQKSENPLFHHLDKAPRTPAFECEGYWAWGSSVVKGDDGKYHMFVSRFPKSLPFHPPRRLYMPCPRYRKDLIGSAKWPSLPVVRNTGTDAPHTIHAF